MIGSYYEPFPLDPIKGLANVSSQASLAHEALQSLLMGTLGRFVPWAEQTVSGWQEITSPGQNYDVFPLNAETLKRAEDLAAGSAVGMIGALFRAPVPLRVVDELFAKGPYHVVKGEAIYRVDDEKPTPTPQFLYFGVLSDEGTHDGYGTYDALEQAVTAAGGELVFVLPSERTGEERAAPVAPASTAIVAELTPEAPPPESLPLHHTAGYYLGAVASLLGGAFVGYHVFKKR